MEALFKRLDAYADDIGTKISEIAKNDVGTIWETLLQSNPTQWEIEEELYHDDRTLFGFSRPNMLKRRMMTLKIDLTSKISEFKVQFPEAKLHPIRIYCQHLEILLSKRVETVINLQFSMHQSNNEPNSNDTNARDTCKPQAWIAFKYGDDADNE